MTSIKVVHVSPLVAPPRFIVAKRDAELRRIFGAEVEIVRLSSVELSPGDLVHAVREHDPDAVVLASARLEHRQPVEALTDTLLMLYPVYESFRNNRGETQERLVGFGVLRPSGPKLLADGELAERSALGQELAIQRALQREAGGHPTSGSGR